jgi:hypothetical protein
MMLGTPVLEDATEDEFAAVLSRGAVRVFRQEFTLEDVIGPTPARLKL